MYKGFNEKNGGITLIALVVTIVVLLILAGVSLNAVIGNSGIITRTQEASKETDIAETREQILMELMGIYAGSGDYTNDDVITAVKKVMGDDDIAIEVGQKTVTTAKGNEVDISDLWKGITLLEMYLAGESCTTENCADENHLHIGDYVSYQPGDTNSATNYVEVGESQTGYSSTQRYEYDEITQWRVLGLTEDRKQVKLISANPIRKASETSTAGVTTTDDLYLALRGAEGYVYGEDTLDKICSIYSNSSLEATAKSIRMEDINLALGVTVTRDENGVPTVTYNGSSIDSYSSRGYLENYIYKDGDYSPEGYLNSQTKTAGEIVFRTAYFYGISNFEDSTVKRLIFDGTDIGDGKEYWVASTGKKMRGTVLYFGASVVWDGSVWCADIPLFNAGGGATTFWWAVRPVLALGTNVTKTQVFKTTAREDTTWNGAMSPSEEN